MFNVPEKYRVKKHPTLSSTYRYGNNGAFRVPLNINQVLWVIASDDDGWEHVSVHEVKSGHKRTPNWEQMCFIKNLFWSEEDCIIQYHPPKSDYIDCHKNVLHLWRPVGQKIPQPPSIMVGPKSKKK